MQKDQLFDRDGRSVRHERRHEDRPIRGRAQLLDGEPAHHKAQAQTHEEVPGAIPISFYHGLHVTGFAVICIRSSSVRLYRGSGAGATPGRRSRPSQTPTSDQLLPSYTSRYSPSTVPSSAGASPSPPSGGAPS